MKKMKFSLLVVALSMSLVAIVSAAPQGLNILYSFTSGETILNLATYITATDTVGLLGITHPGHKVSYAFTIAEWEQMRTLIQKGVALPAKQDWLAAGCMAESGTASPSHLLIYVNETTVQFIISDPTLGTENFLLPRSDANNFLNQSAELAKVLKN